MKNNKPPRKPSIRDLINNISPEDNPASTNQRAEDILAMIRSRAEEEESSQGWQRGCESEPFHQFTANVSQRELADQPLYSAGYQQGYEAGKIEAEEHARLTVRALMKLYIDSND